MQSKRLQVSHLPIGPQPVHITYRLAGSIPKSTLHQLEATRDDKLGFLDRHLKATNDPHDIKSLKKQRFVVNAKFELEIDKILHAQEHGQFYLSIPAVRDAVGKSWKDLHEMERIFLIAYCIMGNHVHVLVKSPNEELMDSAQLLKSHKGYTARKANELLGRQGSAFWEGNYFDRTVRPDRFNAALWYVVNNPVVPGLVANWRDWPGTYVHPDYHGYLIEED